MSCYEWTRGEIKLPSAEFARVRKAVQTAMTAQSQRRFDFAQRFWKGLNRKQQTDATAYLEAVNALRVDDYQLVWKLQGVAQRWHDEPAPKPRRLVKTDFFWPTNRTTEYYDGEMNVTFDPAKRSLVYSVEENNHAREHAARTVLGQTIDKILTEVRWTHGTGGVLLGNDEYSREAGESHEGGGGSYVVAAYGYLGAKEAPTSVHTPFTNAKGERLGVELKRGRYGFTGKVVPYRPTVSRYAW